MSTKLLLSLLVFITCLFDWGESMPKGEYNVVKSDNTSARKTSW